MLLCTLSKLLNMELIQNGDVGGGGDTDEVGCDSDDVDDFRNSDDNRNAHDKGVSILRMIVLLE